MSAWMNVASGTAARASSICRAEMSTPVTLPPGGERAGHRNAGAAAEVEDVGTRRDPLERRASQRSRVGGRSGVAPLVVALGDRVVAVGDDPRGSHGVSTSLGHDAITTS